MIDPGEIYTLTELSERVREVTEQGKGIILCRQRKETEDAALVDAAVAFGIGQMKLGSPGCLEAAVKYNRLLKLEESWENRWERIVLKLKAGYNKKESTLKAKR